MQAVSIPTSSEEELLAQQAAEEAAEYDRLKLELQLWTFGTSLLGAASIWAMYSKVCACQRFHPSVSCTYSKESQFQLCVCKCQQQLYRASCRLFT